MRANLHFCAKVGTMSETTWERLYRLVETRRGQLGVTQNGLQGLGGPSAEWLRQIRNRQGLPSPRMAASLRELDLALGWKEGTAWGLVVDDRSGWSAETLEDEDEALTHGPSLSDIENDLRNWETIVLNRLRGMTEDRRKDAMRAISDLLGMDL